MNDVLAPREQTPSITAYFVVGAALSTWSALLFALTRQATEPAPPAQAVIGPVVAMVALTALVWLAMVVLRNLAIMSGWSSVAYYVDYKSKVPDEWIERPARTFNNLLQVPILFYIVCVLMLVTGQVDRAQVALCWAFVAARSVHAAVYIALNRVPVRFACWIASCIALGVIWTRFALQSAPGWW